MWAAEVVSSLLAPNHTGLDRLVAGSRLVGRALALSLAHPMCSALHTRALRMLRSCCVSKVAALYAPLFTAGLGAGLTRADVGAPPLPPPGEDGAEAEDGAAAEAAASQPCGSLQQLLAERGARMARRGCGTQGLV